MSVKALVAVGRGSAIAEVDVYRDGDVVTVVGHFDHLRQTPYGAAKTRVGFVSSFETVAAYDWAKARAFERAPLLYTRMVGALGIDDNAQNAPSIRSRVAAMPTTTSRPALPPAPPARAAPPTRASVVAVAGSFADRHFTLGECVGEYEDRDYEEHGDGRGGGR
jgi:hypothetical protein